MMNLLNFIFKHWKSSSETGMGRNSCNFSLNISHGDAKKNAKMADNNAKDNPFDIIPSLFSKEN